MNPSLHGTAVYRNGLRIQQIRRIKSSLELYYNDHKKYPQTLQELVPQYMGKLEVFPNVFQMEGIKKPACPIYEPLQYNVAPDASRYTIKFCLPENTLGYEAGYQIVTPEAIP